MTVVGGSELTGLKWEVAPQLLSLLSLRAFNEAGSELREDYDDPGGFLPVWLISVCIDISLKTCSECLLEFGLKVPETRLLTISSEGVGSTINCVVLVGGYDRGSVGGMFAQPF